MQIIFLLLALFAIGCVLYGISAGVQTIARGFTRLTEGACNNVPPEKPSPVFYLLPLQKLPLIPPQKSRIKNRGQMRVTLRLFNAALMNCGKYSRCTRKAH